MYCDVLTQSIQRTWQAPVGISEALEILVGFKEGGRGCLVTTKDFFWLIYIIHGSSGHSMDAHFCMLRSSRCMHF